jgi:hypothetical protein
VQWQRIAKYIVNFNRLATQVNWGNGALCHVFYRRLPDCIKDMITQYGKPPTLVGMKDLAQAIDARYWECKAKTTRDSVRPANSGSSSGTTKNLATPAKSSDSGSSKKPSETPKPSTPASKRPDLTDKLGKDSKLTASERKHRLNNKLCLFCGGAGHMARECSKYGSSASKIKARAVTIEEVEDTTNALVKSEK